MTEDEAKTKWCPMVRQDGYPNGQFVAGLNRSDQVFANCIGSACVMWRDSVSDPVPHFEPGMGHGLMQTVGGYCGLAGKP